MEGTLVGIGYQALGILIPALCAIAIELLRRRLGLEKIRKIQEELKAKQQLAILTVKFVEQAYKDLHGEEKYNQAAEWLSARIQELGLHITQDEVKGLIEAALRMVKDELGEEWAIKKMKG